MSDYRWERASGGEVPAGACPEGHGWEYVTTDGAPARTVPAGKTNPLHGVSQGRVRRARLKPQGLTLVRRDIRAVTRQVLAWPRSQVIAL